MKSWTPYSAGANFASDQALTLHYERKLYMLADTAINRGLIGKYLEFFQYPMAA